MKKNENQNHGSSQRHVPSYAEAEENGDINAKGQACDSLTRVP